MLTLLIVGLIAEVSIINQDVFASQLERNQISRFHVTAVPSGDVTYLHIRGLPPSSSSSGCSKLQVTVSGHEVWLRGHELLAKQGGPFDYVLTIPSNIRRVATGPKHQGSR